MAVDIFSVNFVIYQNGKEENVLYNSKNEPYWDLDILPRKGDVINIDSGHFLVLYTVYTYKDCANPTVYLKPLGDYKGFLNLLRFKIL